ncbi:hypothetical protein [Rhizobium sp.]|uniref:hypothetical protein n=1 Tax=Rhizobium sp. TaxID=391 RepID=UPI0028A84C3B
MAKNFRGYTLSRSPEDTHCQFEFLVRGIAEGRYPNIAAADKLMDGVLTASLQKIANGFRQPETMLWYQSWANYLAKGRPDLMQDAAVRMMTRDERWLPRIVDDETALLPKTTVNAVFAGEGARLRGEWKAPHAVDTRTEEQMVADRQEADARYFRETAKSMISEIERVTREKFARTWKKKDELHAALRAHFKECGYDEELDMRWLRMGAY